MKGRWESNINVWFPCMYSQKWNCAGSIFPKQTYNVLSPNSYTHISVRELYISRIGLSILLQPNMWTDPGNIQIAHRHMNVKIGSEATHFLLREYINLIFGTVYREGQERKAVFALSLCLSKWILFFKSSMLDLSLKRYLAKYIITIVATNKTTLFKLPHAIFPQNFKNTRNYNCYNK